MSVLDVCILMVMKFELVKRKLREENHFAVLYSIF